MPSRFCPACRAVHAEGQSCPKTLQRRKQHDRERGNYRQRGYTPGWDEFRLVVLREEPTCRMCAEKGKYVPARMVDHRIPIAAGGELLDRDNVQPLCFSCHRIKTEEDKQRYPEVYR